MPVYEYVCEECGTPLERIESLADPPEPPTCPRKHHYTVTYGQIGETQVPTDPDDPGYYLCPGKMKRVISQSTFHLKGGGWAKDGY